MAQETFKVRNAHDAAAYECDNCGSVFRLLEANTDGIPEYYDVNCPLCGNFPRK